MVNVLKWDGRLEPLDREKILRTIIRLGASSEIAEKIASRIGEEAYEGITTKEIFTRIQRGLKEQGGDLTLRRDLRSALGLINPKPDFERYIHVVLREHGYEVSPAPIIQGACVTHEIDGIAKKDGELIYLEVKNHSGIHVFTPFEVTLSAKAKLDDIREGFRKGLNVYNFDKVLIVCNTRFTEHARDYARCVGIEHLGWNVPDGLGLERLIEEKKVYSVTMLLGITGNEIKALSEKEIYTLKQMVEAEDGRYNISKSRLQLLQREASSILAN